MITELGNLSTGFLIFEGVLGLLDLAVVVTIPIVMYQLKTTQDRFKKGDQKFEELGEANARVAAQLDHISRQGETMQRKLDALTQKDADVEITGIGSMGELRASMERDFVRKREFELYIDRADAKQQQILEAIINLARE